MINLNVNITIKPDAMPETNAAYVAAFIKELASLGYNLNSEHVKQVRAEKEEKGPIELQYLEQSGKQRMKVPSNFNGSREEWAAKLLVGDALESDVPASDDPYATFH
jgi:hypothetical protein